MIRILHSVSNMDRAGIETMLMNYYRHMDRSRVQFDFLCNKIKPGAYDEEIRQLGGKIYHTPGLNPAKYPQYLDCMNTIFRENPDYQIVEAHNGALGVYALYAAKANHIPNRIFHAHGASITRDWKLPLKLICKALLPANMNRHFTCGVAAAECYFGRAVVEQGDYELIPNAIEVDRFLFDEDTRGRIRRMYDLKDKHVIGHVGRFMAQKNHAFLLELFAEYSKYDAKGRLVLLGDGELMNEMRQRAEKLGIMERVIFAGNVSNVSEWYQAFDCFILPSLWEGLPVVGVEAQAADLPCVFSASVTREIGLSEQAQFVSLHADKQVWIMALQKALDYRDRRNVSQLIAEHHYDISMEAVRLQNRYLELAGETL